MKYPSLYSRVTTNYYKFHIKADSHSEYVAKIIKPKVERN